MAGSGLINRISRVLIGLVPALVANGLWQFFYRRGSYRFAFAAMIIGLLSLPFAVGTSVHETAEWLGITSLKAPVDWLQSANLFGAHAALPNIQLFIAFLVPVVWSAYVAIQSRTLTSATIVGAYFVTLYLIGLDFWGLGYFLYDHIGYGGLSTLPAAIALVAAGVYAGQN